MRQRCSDGLFYGDGNLPKVLQPSGGKDEEEHAFPI
jgi:hypothetical protein